MKKHEFISEAARQAFDKPRALAECLVKNRIINCHARFPAVINFDVTGKGMCALAQHFWNDLPDFVSTTSLAEAPTIYLTGIGDINYDSAPLQVTNGAAFEATALRQELTKLWLEAGGGGGEDIEYLRESYEMMAYFLAKRFIMDNAAHAICVFVADEAPRTPIEKAELDWWLGGKNQSTDAVTAFSELNRQFKGNVFLIFRPSFGAKENAAILAQWRALIGDDKILILPNNRLIAAAIRELIIVAAANHSIADAQKKLNELAPNITIPTQATESENRPTPPIAAPTLKKRPRKPRPSDVWRLQPKVKEPPKKVRKTKTAKPSDAFRI